MDAALRIVLVVCLLLAGCGRDNIRPDLPDAAMVAKPTLVYVDRYVYVPIDPDLTREELIAEGPLSQCPDIAASRKAALRRVNARLLEISAIQGTPVASP